MSQNIRDFADTEKMRLAIEDIKRYQKAYIEANSKPKGIPVKYKPGWYAISRGGGNWLYVQPNEFRNMIDRLENRTKS